MEIVKQNRNLKQIYKLRFKEHKN